MFANKKTLKTIWPWPFLAFATLLIHSSHTVNSDEGIILNAAWNIINHKKLYLDSFEFIGPGAPYLLAVWWKFFGISYLSAAILSYLVNFSLVVALYLISQHLNLKKYTFLASINFIVLASYWPPINHNSFSIAAITWATYFILKNKSYKNYLLGGVFSSLAIMFTQHRGLAAAIIFLAYLAYQALKQKINWRKFIIFAAGLIIPIVSLFIFWSPKILYYNLIIFPTKNYPPTNFLPLNWWLICLLLITIIIFCNWLNKNFRHKIGLLSWLSLGLLITSLLRADIEHVLQSLVIVLPLLATVFELFFNKEQDRPIIHCLVIALLINCFIWPPFDNYVPKAINQLINKNCNIKNGLYAGPFMPGIYFETKTLNPTPYGFLITNQQTPEQFNQALNIIEKDKPSCLVLNYSIVEKFNYNKNNPLDNYLNQAYKLVDSLGNVKILTLK